MAEFRSAPVSLPSHAWAGNAAQGGSEGARDHARAVGREADGMAGGELEESGGADVQDGCGRSSSDDAELRARMYIELAQ
jgi:hypothetical protein